MSARTTGPSYDVVVIGGGIAGVSVAYELATDHTVLLLEMEPTLAHHATGRSAAMYLETYGGHQVRALTIASRHFLEHPPAGFHSTLMTPRPLLQVARPGRGDVIDALFEQVRPLVTEAAVVDAAEAARLCPILRPEAVAQGLYEPHAMELDVHALHQGYVAGLRARGGSIRRGCRVEHLEQTDAGWAIHATEGVVARAPVVVNAAGAWSDRVAVAAGCRPVGLTPQRRTVFTIPADGLPTDPRLPLLYDADETFYVKPEGEQFLCSPADRTPCEPGDAKADPIAIARALDEIRDVTSLAARSVRTSWAGLRTFAPDEEFVVGRDPAAPGFCWLAGQGGYGIQTAPASARLAASLVRGEALPDDLARLGLEASQLSPARFGPA